MMKIKKLEYHSTSNDGYAFEMRPNIVDITDKINEIIDKLNETEEAEAVRHGHWNIFHNDNIPYTLKCSECGEYTIVNGKYCPNCGCKMDLDEVNDNE